MWQLIGMNLSWVWWNEIGHEGESVPALFTPPLAGDEGEKSPSRGVRFHREWPKSLALQHSRSRVAVEVALFEMNGNAYT